MCAVRLGWHDALAGQGDLMTDLELWTLIKQPITWARSYSLTHTRWIKNLISNSVLTKTYTTDCIETRMCVWMEVIVFHVYEILMNILKCKEFILFEEKSVLNLLKVYYVRRPTDSSDLFPKLTLLMMQCNLYRMPLFCGLSIWQMPTVAVHSLFCVWLMFVQTG